MFEQKVHSKDTQTFYFFLNRSVVPQMQVHDVTFKPFNGNIQFLTRSEGPESELKKKWQIMHLCIDYEHFQQDEDSVAFKLLECIYKEIYQWIFSQIDYDLRSRENKSISELQFRWKLLKSNFQKLVIILYKIF